MWYSSLEGIFTLYYPELPELLGSKSCDES